MTFNSKYSIGQLVEYKQDRNDETNKFGFIVAVTFWKSDAVNFTASYKIEKVNGGEVDDGIYETNIVKDYRLSV